MIWDREHEDEDEHENKQEHVEQEQANRSNGRWQCDWVSLNTRKASTRVKGQRSLVFGATLSRVSRDSIRFDSIQSEWRVLISLFEYFTVSVSVRVNLQYVVLLDRDWTLDECTKTWERMGGEGRSKERRGRGEERRGEERRGEEIE